MYKNWQAICALENDHLKLLVATTQETDAYTLAGLEKGFPDLFSETQTPQRIPASALREAAREWSHEEYQSDEYVEFDTELCWVNIVDRFTIPILFDFAHPNSGLSSSSKGMPRSILEQLVGQKLKMGLTVEHKGIKCLIIDIGFRGHEPKLMEVITQIPEVEWMRLVSAEHIDLNA